MNMKILARYFLKFNFHCRNQLVHEHALSDDATKFQISLGRRGRILYCKINEVEKHWQPNEIISFFTISFMNIQGVVQRKLYNAIDGRLRVDQVHRFYAKRETLIRPGFFNILPK
jgi:hypothetical protein